MTFTKEAQLPIRRYGTAKNPQLSDGTTTIEFSYPPQPGSTVKYETNQSLHQTIGGTRRSQEDSMIRVARISWLEPSDFIPNTILEMMYGGGDRTVLLTYTHHRRIFSQLGDGVEPTDTNGVIPITGFIQKPFDPQFAGHDFSGTQMSLCSMIFIESDEVQP